MKKNYQKPNIELVQYHIEQVIASSIQLNINEDTSIESETEIWSNEESNLNIW